MLTLLVVESDPVRKGQMKALITQMLVQFHLKKGRFGSAVGINLLI